MRQGLKAAIGCLLILLGSGMLFGQTTDSASAKIWTDHIEDGAAQLIAPQRIIVICEEYEGIYGMRGGGKAWSADSTLLANAATGNLTQVLQNIPSLSLKRYAPGGLATPTFRGTGAGHTQVFWEGLPLNSSMLGQQDFSLGAGNLFVGVGAYYGGSSLTLGSGGLGGALNLTSATNPHLGYGSEFKLRQQAGSWGSYGSNAEAEFFRRKWASSTRLYFNSAANDFRFANLALPGSPIERLANAGLQQFGGSQYLRYIIGPKFGFLSGNLWAFRSQRALPPTMLTTASDEVQADAALRGILAWDVVVKGGSLKMQAAYFTEHLRYDYQLAGIHSLSQSRRYIASAIYQFASSSRPITMKETSLRYVHDQATTDGYMAGAQQSQVSAMARGEWKMKPQAYTSLLIRQELFDGRLTPVMGYLGSSYRINRLRGSLLGNLSRNYRIPTLNDRFWQPGGNPNLRPELSHAAEVHFKRARDLFYWKQANRNWAIGGFYNHVQDWILWVPGTGNVWHPENVRTVNAYGVEANANYAGDLSAAARYKLAASYTFTQSRDQDGDQLIYTPQHIAFARLQVSWRKFDIQYSQDYNGSRYTVADNSASIPGFTTGDLSLGMHLGKPKEEREFVPFAPGSNQGMAYTHYRRGLLDLQVGMRNIWNAEYQTVAWRPMPGRSIFVRLDCTLGHAKM
jgi:vitamin B12 transporter